MDVLTDRTSEVEQKLKATRIDTRDGCSFWKARDGAMVQIRQCWYCAYASFDRENPDVYQMGLCNYKRLTPDPFRWREEAFQREAMLTDAQLDTVAAAGGHYSDATTKNPWPKYGAEK